MPNLEEEVAAEHAAMMLDLVAHIRSNFTGGWKEMLHHLQEQAWDILQYPQDYNDYLRSASVVWLQTDGKEQVAVVRNRTKVWERINNR